MMAIEKHQKKSIFYKLGLVLLSLAVLGWVIAVIIPFVPFSPVIKAAAISGTVIVAEILFWIGALFVGKEVAAKFKRYLNPKNWRKKGKRQEHEE